LCRNCARYTIHTYKGSYLVVSHLLNPRTKIEQRAKHSGENHGGHLVKRKKLKKIIIIMDWEVSRAR
jgi:hypothetical protein